MSAIPTTPLVNGLISVPRSRRLTRYLSGVPVSPDAVVKLTVTSRPGQLVLVLEQPARTTIESFGASIKTKIK